MIRGILIVLGIVFVFVMLAAAGENRVENQQAETRDEVHATVEAEGGDKLDKLIDVTSNMVTKVGEIDQRLGGIEDRVSNLENGLLPTSTPTPAPGSTAAPQPTTTSNGSSDAYFNDSATLTGCRADQVGTFAEDSDGNKERLEIGGGDLQVVVYYPKSGDESVAYIIGTREQPANWWGHGIILQLSGNCDDMSYDDVEELVLNHRLSAPWSGVIVDLRGTEPVECNVGSKTDEQIDTLLNYQKSEFRNRTA